MSAVTTETQHLRIARAIAYEIERHTGEPGWATESLDKGRPCVCTTPPHVPWCEHSARARGPRPLTTLADACEAWVASGGDPERGPCLFDVGVHQGSKYDWHVTAAGWRMCVGNIERWPNGKTCVCGDLTTPWTDLDLLARIIRAVDEVTRAR